MEMNKKETSKGIFEIEPNLLKVLRKKYPKKIRLFKFKHNFPSVLGGKASYLLVFDISQEKINKLGLIESNSKEFKWKLFNYVIFKEINKKVPVKDLHKYTPSQDDLKFIFYHVTNHVCFMENFIGVWEL